MIFYIVAKISERLFLRLENNLGNEMIENVFSVAAFKYAESTLAEKCIFPGGALDKMLPISFTIYLIKTDKHMILVDAGCDTMPGFEMKNFCGPVEALKRQGIMPEDITDVIITHSHHDHIEAVCHFDKATIYIQQHEYERAGGKYIPEGFRVQCFQESVDVAGCVKVIKVGGHSIGSCVVEFAIGEQKYVITGDECYARENLEKKIPTGSSYCFEKSLEFIEKYSQKEYTVLLCHEL